MLEGETCPLEGVHKRLADAHVLWHEAHEAYHSPARFPTFLNACIQALRNVTFVLQKAKGDIPDFDEWYETQRARMAGDPTLRWLVDARNHVVKRGDLLTDSVASVALIAGYAEPPEVEFDVPPETESGEIIAGLLERGLPEWATTNGILIVTRSWRVADLGKTELLGALGHAFGALADVLLAAHVQAGATEAQARECVSRHYDGEHGLVFGGGTRATCMVRSAERHTVAIELATTKEVGAQSVSPRPSGLEPGVEKAQLEERYGAWPERFSRDATSREVAEVFFDQAARVFLKDGYHLPFAFLFHEGGERMSIVQMDMPQPRDRTMVLRELVTHVELTKAHTVMFIGESWRAPADSIVLGETVHASVEKEEVLDLTLISRTGGSFTWLAPILRDGDSLALGPREEQPPVGAMYTIPVLRLWARWESAGGAG